MTTVVFIFLENNFLIKNTERYETTINQKVLCPKNILDEKSHKSPAITENITDTTTDGSDTERQTAKQFLLLEKLANTPTQRKHK